MTPMMVKRFILLLRWAETRMWSANPSGHPAEALDSESTQRMARIVGFSSPVVVLLRRELLRALARLKFERDRLAAENERLPARVVSYYPGPRLEVEEQCRWSGQRFIRRECPT